MEMPLGISNQCGTIRGLRGRSPLGERVAENAKGVAARGTLPPTYKESSQPEPGAFLKSL